MAAPQAHPRGAVATVEKLLALCAVPGGVLYATFGHARAVHRLEDCAVVMTPEEQVLRCLRDAKDGDSGGVQNVYTLQGLNVGVAQPQNTNFVFATEARARQWAAKAPADTGCAQLAKDGPAMQSIKKALTQKKKVILDLESVRPTGRNINYTDYTIPETLIQKFIANTGPAWIESTNDGWATARDIFAYRPKRKP